MPLAFKLVSGYESRDSVAICLGLDLRVSACPLDVDWPWERDLALHFVNCPSAMKTSY